MFDNIPLEMRDYRSWVLWKFEETESGKPTKVPYSANDHKASPTDSATWTSYEHATRVYAENPNRYAGIGFVLSPNDPYGFIDLDEPKNPDGSPLDPEEFTKRMNRQRFIHDSFASYSELSPSGNGLHIIIKGSVPNGRKRSSVEVYSDARFMTMTGNVYRASQIKDCSDLFNELWAEMGKGASAQMFYAGLANATQSDAQVMDMARGAVNGEKFSDLFDHANWAKYYPSQSEADFALMDILAFYSQNAEQTQKLFLQSALAQRVKSRAQYRLNYMLNRCFDKMLPPVDFEGLRDQVNAAIQKSIKANQLKESIEKEISAKALVINEDVIDQTLGLPQELPDDLNSIYMPPEGLVGQIAKFIYAQAPLPVPEIALSAAIGLMSGICGRAYNVSATGLNQYTLLLAATGTGKESSGQGINKLMTEVIKIVPAAKDFMGPSEIASPQALTKYLGDKSACVLSMVGEFGLHLKQMAAENAAPHMLGLKRLLLDLYNKSGESDKLHGMIYSDNAKNTESLLAPSFSILGESAPERFYEALTENMISEGLLPRFTIIEYHGDRVLPNDAASLVKPSPELIQAMSTLCANALNLSNQKKVVHVQYTEAAKAVLNDFRMKAHNNIVGSMEVRRQLWNRAHLKALKLSATVAVGCHPFEPTITEESARWAIRIIEADIKNMLGRFESGDVGVNNEETKQLKLLNKLIRKFLTSPWKDIEKVAGEKMQILHTEKVVPYGWLQRSTSTSPAFKTDRQGATNALKRALKTLEERGEIQAMARSTLVQKFGTGAQAYAISIPSAFGL